MIASRRPSNRRPLPDTRAAYNARVRHQYGTLRQALDAGQTVEQAAQAANMDVGIAKLWLRLDPDQDWPDRQ